MENKVNYTVKDTESDFLRFQAGEIFWDQIRGFNDEHKWWIIRNKPNSSFICNDELMTDEMLKECILLGYSDFYRTPMFKKGEKENEHIKQFMKKYNSLNERICSLNLTEDEWIQGIKNRKSENTFFFIDEYIEMVLQCAKLTYSIAEAIFYKNPVFLTHEKINDLLLNSEKKYEITDYLMHQILDNDLHLGMSSDLPISDETWKYIESKFDDSWISDDILEHPNCPDSIRQKEIKNSKYISRKMKKNMKANEIILWYNLYKDEISDVDYYLKEFKSEEWEQVVTLQPEIFQYLYKPKAKVCEAAVKAEPMNIKYVKKPSEKLKVLAIQLNPKCQEFVEITEKTSELLGYPIQKTMETPKPYPEKYYLVSFEEDLCDEGYLHYHTIVEGKDMVEFMKQTFRVSFGNLYDDEIRRVSKCANVKAITEEEYNVLKKLDLDYSSSGYFSFDDDEDDEEEEED